MKYYEITYTKATAVSPDFPRGDGFNRMIPGHLGSFVSNRFDAIRTALSPLPKSGWERRDHPIPEPGRTSFRSARSGATAVEFALIAPIFLVTVLFILSIGYVMVMSAALDNATRKASRQIKTGQVQSANMNQSQFISQTLCPLLPSLFNCGNLIVNIQTVSTSGAGANPYPNGFYQFVKADQSGLIVPQLSNNQTNFCPGNPQGYVFVQILYPVNIFLSLISLSPIATTYNGQKVFVIMATTTFRNEPFGATSSC